MKIQNVIFDMDGTILNTLDDICDSVNFMLKLNGYETISINTVKGYVGNGVKVLIKRCVPNASDTEFLKCFNDFATHYQANKENKTAPYNGIINAMKELQKLGIKMAVVSNKYNKAVEELTDKLFGDYIKVAIGESDKIKPKPEPDGVFFALSKLNASKLNSVYIGDSEVDALTAKNSGLKFIGVTWGFRERSVLIDAGAREIIDCPSQIVEAVRRLSND